MKKIFIVFLCLMAVCLVCFLWPEYGSGYSEVQRRLWNERRALYPVAWVIDGAVPRRDIVNSYSDISRMTGWEPREVELLIEEKKEKEAELVKELEANRDKSGPDCMAEEPSSVNVSRLPLYGLTKKEVAERALSGDGDACLKMVQYQLRRTVDADRQVEGLSWREKFEAEKWLDRAVRANRPGAEFLKTLFTEVCSFRKSLLMPNGESFLHEKMEAKKVPGYANFLECLKRGDYIAYGTAVLFLTGSDLSEENRLLYTALSMKAGLGEPVSQRDLALLFFEMEPLLGRDDFSYSIKKDIEKKRKNWEDQMKWLPDSWKKCVVKGLFSCGVINAGGTRTMKRYREASRYARAAALQGDLTGMYLWLSHGITCQERYSVKEWDDILKYGHILFEAGYVPYLESIRKAQNNFMGKKGLDERIPRSFYSRKSYEELWNKDYLKSRGRLSRFAKKVDLAEIREILQVVSLTGGTDDFLADSLTGGDFTPGGVLFGSSKEAQEYLVEQVEKWAEEGDIHAMYRLAGIYEKGIGIPVDLGKAYALYGKALAGADGHPLFRVCIRSGSGHDHFYEGIHLKHVARLKRAAMVLDHPDFPGRNEKEAYDQILESAGHYAAGKYCCYLLGLFHEKGIGRPVDKAVALDYYKKGGTFHRDCLLGKNRLSSPADGKKEEVQK